MLSLRGILSRQNNSFKDEKMLRKLSMTDDFWVLFDSSKLTVVQGYHIFQ